MKALSTLALAAITLISTAAVQAAEVYPKMYDATYECQSMAGKSTMRLISDGKGKMRCESGGAGYKVVSITDYPAKTTWSIMDAQKMITKMALKDPYEGKIDTNWVKKKHAKDLGTKVIAGKNCHGYSYNEKGTDTEMWVDESGELMVKSISKTGGQTTTVTMISSNPAAPAASMFVVPTTGYKLTSY
jgi:hypothetical protein